MLGDHKANTRLRGVRIVRHDLLEKGTAPPREVVGLPATTGDAGRREAEIFADFVEGDLQKSML
jgi:hypothetical protein